MCYNGLFIEIGLKYIQYSVYVFVVGNIVQ